MREIIQWLKDAITTKKIVIEMSYYRASDGQLKATDGRITAGHPCDPSFKFLVPGTEFERIVARLPGQLKIDHGEDKITIRSGKSYGTMECRDVNDWDYPVVEEEEWMPIPKGLIEALRKLLPFVSDNATHNWAMGITLENGWAFATNNIALAGVPCPQLGAVNAIVPLWAVEFLIARESGLINWCWTEDYVAFQWENGAWLRSTLINDYFPEQVGKMVKQAQAESCDVFMDEDFKEVFFQIAGVAEGPITITEDRIFAPFAKAEMGAEIDIPELTGMQTIWAAKYLEAVVKVADWWQPTKWPNPAPFSGEGIVGFIVGRQR